MPISIDEYRFPKFVKYQQKNPFIEDSKAKFMDGTTYNGLRRFKGDTFPQTGYNPAANSPTVKQVNLDKDEVVLPPE